MRVLGIEGTAWAASAAVYDADADEVTIETDPYLPDSGGIHPREAAEHMGEAIPRVVERAHDAARGPIDAVAFSRGPGLGPCLRVAGTAARALAGSLEVPLVGVNHMVAHLEVGRHRSGFDDPVCLNASGANAHVLAYRNGRYRVLGETMDTGVGNALDKFTRHVGWSHPGGPKVEAAAVEGEYVELPYVVKGMDFSFSGLTSAAKDAYDDGVPVEDVCRGLEETVFAMLTEVAERALSLTDGDELVLGGGVGQNDRLRGMLATMCDQRGADFFVPEDRFLRDNAGMIALLGAKMLAAGDTLLIEDSRVDPDFRPDEVTVTWRAEEPNAEGGPSRPHERAGGGDRAAGPGGEAGPAEPRTVRGAEATVEVGPDRVVKRRVPRSYRHPDLDARLRRDRTVLEARLTSDARRQGVPTPVVHDVDVQEGVLVFEHVGRADLRDGLTEARVRDVGRHLAAIHRAGFVHGDPTTRNVRVTPGGEPRADAADPDGAGGPGATAPDGARTYLVDFGLGYYTDDVEDHAMDLHVFEQSLSGTADDPGRLRTAFEAAYRDAGSRSPARDGVTREGGSSDGPAAVLDRLREIEGRGRYQ